jgi:TIR domain
MAAGPYIFISHSSDEAADAQGLCAFLEQHGLATWIAPRDVRPGRDYSEQLQQAIENCGAFIVLVTKSANSSPYVRVETEMAFSLDKPLFPVRTSDVAPGKGLALFLKIKHWTDAFGAQREHNLRRLIEEMHFVLGGGAALPAPAAPPPSRHSPPPEPPEPLRQPPPAPQPRSRRPLLIGLVAAAVVAALIVVLVLTRHGRAPSGPSPTDGTWAVSWQSVTGAYSGTFEAHGASGVLTLDISGEEQSRVRQDCTISGQGPVAIRCSNPQLLAGEGAYSPDNFDLSFADPTTMRGTTSSGSGETANVDFNRR